MKSAVRQLLFGAWTPRNLFGNTQGAWYDPSDLSSMFQEAAGTTPCAVGSPVGLRLDKSGRGNHATQGTSASRPILRQDTSGRYYLEYDGFDDGMATAAIDFTGTDKVTVFAGVYKASDAAAGSVLELSANASTSAGAFWVYAPDSLNPNFSFASRGATTLVNASRAPFAAPFSAVVTGQGNIGAPSAVLNVNGSIGAPNATAQGGGNYGNYPLYIGRRGGTTNPFNGRDYGLIVVGRALNETEIARTERFLASRMGVTL